MRTLAIVLLASSYSMPSGVLYGQQWREFADKEANFRIELPGAPIKTDSGNTTSFVLQYRLGNDSFNYMIFQRTINDEERKTWLSSHSEYWIDSFRQAYAGHEFKVLLNIPIRCDGYHGRQLAFTHKKIPTNIRTEPRYPTSGVDVRLILYGDTSYVLIRDRFRYDRTDEDAHNYFGTPDSAQHFFRSFRLLSNADDVKPPEELVLDGAWVAAAKPTGVFEDVWQLEFSSDGTLILNGLNNQKGSYKTEDRKTPKVIHLNFKRKTFPFVAVTELNQSGRIKLSSNGSDLLLRRPGDSILPQTQ